MQVKDLEPLGGFVPHEILGVAQDAELKHIKKAYRRLSREYHPDKNRDNAEKAKKEFMKITKAYTIMTDPKARENFEKFGHPDGWGHFNVGIALPAKLEDKDQQLFVLTLFFILVIIVIPGYFYSELMKEERDIGGVTTANREIFKKLISETMMGAKIPVLLGQGEEFSTMKVGSKKELELMKKIRNNQKVQSAIPEVGPDERPI